MMILNILLIGGGIFKINIFNKSKGEVKNEKDK